VNLPAELENILRALDSAHSSKEAEKAMKNVALLSARVHSQIQDSVNQRKHTRHILFDLDPEYVGRYRQLAIAHIERLERAASQLSNDIAWKAGKPILKDAIDNDVDDIIGRCTSLCRLSRVAYVFTFTVADDSSRYETLRERFENAQRNALLLTEAIANSELLSSAEYSQAKALLRSYASSMNRRLGGLPANCCGDESGTQHTKPRESKSASHVQLTDQRMNRRD
jgi:hypothetical protein